ncbi:MAG: UDP-N-acetylmuramoyl-tripeptide--D-alanyl-D-alanine ligase [bacterium]|nr:UDP-N-acetylmuramoyl-tripeptide--D-alanyl-D-alanine ligase [bacterium]
MVKNFFKQIVIVVLWWLTRRIIGKYQPKIVGVIGSVGKTSTKDAVAAVLGSGHQVRASAKSYNGEFGIPLTVIGVMSPWSSAFGWLKVLGQGLLLISFKQDYPAWLVLEVGADRPGDIKKVAQQLNFKVVVITHLPTVPVHVEFFPSAEAVINEKLILAKVVAEQGLVVLNADDPKQVEVKGQLKAHIVTYGMVAGATVRGEHYHIFYNEEGENKTPLGLTFKLDYEGTSLPVRLDGVLGEHQLYPALAAAAVGLKFGVNLVQVAEALHYFRTPPGRLRLIPGIKQTLILDDTYNSSPAALTAGLKTLGQLEVRGRKIAVIGDMLELGDHTIEAHKQAGREAAQVADLVMTVGVRTKFVAEGLKTEKILLKKWHHFSNAKQVGEYLQKNLKAGDVIYLKGSQRIRLEKAVEMIMLEPQKKTTLLCRQEPEWQER